MKRNIERLQHGQYDLLVIGGGINGAGIAHMAAVNGLRVCLVEKNDFAYGTSSKSTKLAHGGLRYLENCEFDLVHESLRERAYLLRSAPHLVKPLSFIIPVYKTNQRAFWMIRLGVFLYDLLSGRRGIGKHKKLGVGEVLKQIPGIKKDGLLGGVQYYDAQIDDARVCLENVLSADQAGAHAANYVEVQSLRQENGKTVEVVAYDKIGENKIVIRAKKVVCAAGPWTNLFMKKERAQAPAKVRATKGVHIVYRGEVSKHAVVIPVQSDGRIFFVIPFNGHTLIGTTDTDYQGNPDDVKTEEEDIDYLFNEARRVFPKKQFKRDQIITTFAGLRPLVQEKGNVSKVSRKHRIEESYSGILYVMGGKYTTYRQIAEDVLRKVMTKGTINALQKTPLFGGGDIHQETTDVAKEYGVAEDIVDYLKGKYGTRYKNVLELIKSDSGLKQRICSCSPTIKAQVVYAIKHEMAVQEDDIIERRLGLVYQDCKTADCRKNVRRILASSLG